MENNEKSVYRTKQREIILDYLKKCHEAALYTAERFGWKVIKCYEGESPLPIEKISEEIFDCVREMI